jgi:hypothetical protein
MKQSKKTKKLLLDFIDAVIDWKVQLKNADIELDNLHCEEYDMWAIAMLKLISEWEWWEESEKHYYNKFFIYETTRKNKISPRI